MWLYLSTERPMPSTTIPDGLKMLAIDIETRPAIAYIWRMWDENIGLDQLIESTEMFSFAARWVGSSRTSTEFYSTFHHGKKEMVHRAWKFLDEANIVLHFNGKRFDVPHLNREFLELDLLPPSPYQQIDLLDTCRRQFQFQSNKLAYISKALGLEGKVEHEGFPLWVKCLNGEKKAWNRMREYNIQDVLLLEDAYYKLRPWILRHPNVQAMADYPELACTACGSDDIERRGYVALSTGRYQRFVCHTCGKWSRSNTREKPSAKILEVAP